MQAEDEVRQTRVFTKERVNYKSTTTTVMCQIHRNICIQFVFLFAIHLVFCRFPDT